MGVETEDGRTVHGVVAADALEDAGAVVQAVGRDVGGGVCPRDDFAVFPDELSFLSVLGASVAKIRSLASAVRR